MQLVIGARVLDASLYSRCRGGTRGMVRPTEGFRSGHWVHRVDKAGHRGWSVRIARAGAVHRRWFPDSAAGGDAAGSLLLAREYRDQKLLELTPLNRVDGTHVRNHTGVIGVRRIEAVNGNGYPYVTYEACWPVLGRDGNGRIQRARRFFSVRKYGEGRAFSLAVEHRRRGVAEYLKRRREQVVGDVVRRGVVAPPRSLAWSEASLAGERLARKAAVAGQ